MYDSKSLEAMLNEIIDKRIKQTLKNKGYEVPYEGQVLSVAFEDETANPYSQRVNVLVVGYDAIVELRNLSGEQLSTNDRVRIYATNDNLANGYIGVKCN